MRISVKHFGPIENVQVDINPLTVIIGKNNLGKSYLAQLYYALLDSTRTVLGLESRRPYFMSRPSENGGVFITRYFHYRHSRPDYFLSEIGAISKQIKKDMSDHQIIQFLVRRINDKFADSFAKTLQASLERSFGIKVGNLVSVSSSEALISWDPFEYLTLTAHIKKRGSLRVNLKPNRRGNGIIRRYQERSSSLLNKLRRARTRKQRYIFELSFGLTNQLQRLKRRKEEQLTWSISVRRRNFFYIPAGRGGLLESYETVVGGLVSLSPVAPVRGLSMPPLPGMAAQFYRVLLELKGRKGPMSKIISTAFKSLLEGDITLQRVRGQAKSRLKYKFSSGGKTSTTDVIHAASMIKELSPIYLIIQEFVEPGDFLLIEEPESHLHPGAQLSFVRIIGTLVSNGVNVFLTTHSDLFLRGVGHLTGKHNAENGTVPIDVKTLAVYWLKGAEFGCVSEQLELAESGLIEDVPTFDEVVKDLYKEEMELERQSRR